MVKIYSTHRNGYIFRLQNLEPSLNEKNASYIALLQDPGSQPVRVSKKKGKSTYKNIIYIMKALDSLDDTVSQVEVDENVEEPDLIREAMTLDDGKTVLLFVAWVTYDDLKVTTMFPEVISFDTTYGTNVERRPLCVGAGTCNNRVNSTVFRAFVPSEWEWVWMHCYEVALPAPQLRWGMKLFLVSSKSIQMETETYMRLKPSSVWMKTVHGMESSIVVVLTT
jgi:hypothetical protein